MTRQTFYVTKPPFVVDPESIDRSSGRQIDWSVVPDSYRMGAVKVAAATVADSGATTMAVTAITGAIPSGTNLYFGQAGEFARLAAAAAAGATALTVDALGTTIESGDVAYYPGTGAKTLPAGKLLVELSNGKVATRAERPGSEVSFGFLETNAIENEPSHALTGYGIIVGGVLFENLLPDAAAGTTGALTDAYKQELVGNTSNPKSTGFVFEQYADNRS